MEKTTVTENPFFHRGPVRDPDYFIGRKRELRRILRQVKQTQAVSIVGPRRIGKSSLTCQISNPTITSAYDVDPAMHFVYIDCQELAGELDDTEIYREFLVAALSVVNDGAHPPVDPLPYLDFEKHIARMTASGAKIVFIFDEFEVLARNQNLDVAFFTQLRALGQKGAVIYVTVSNEPLHKLSFHDRDVLTSPFFNIFSLMELGLMPHHEARSVVVDLLQKVDPYLFNEDDIAFLLRLAGPYPFFLQLAAYELFEEKLYGSTVPTDGVFERVRRKFGRIAEGHFNHMWQKLSSIEQEALRQRLRAPSRVLEFALVEGLERRCVLQNGRFFSEGFKRFVSLKSSGADANGKVYTTPPDTSSTAHVIPSIALHGEINSAHRHIAREMLQQKGVREARFKPLSHGYANSGIYLVEFKQPQEAGYRLGYVLKFASAKDIKAAHENYDTHVKDRLRIAFHDERLTWYPHDIENVPEADWDKELAAAMYRYAQTDGDQVLNLEEFYRQSISKDAPSHDEIESVFSRLFSALDDWQKRGRRQDAIMPAFTTEYKRLPQKLTQLEAAAVQLEALGLDPHVRANPGQFRYQPWVTWRGQRYRNPLHWVHENMNRPPAWFEQLVYAYRPQMVHGDLNFRNILVETTADGALTGTWLIDFSDTHEGHALRDYSTLEADLKFVVTPLQADAFQSAPPHQEPPILALERLLLRPQERQELDLEAATLPSWVAENGRLRAIWHYTRQIRQRVRRHVMVKPDLRPYYLGLLHATLPSLYFNQLNQWQKFYAFLSASLICEKLDGHNQD